MTLCLVERIYNLTKSACLHNDKLQNSNMCKSDRQALSYAKPTYRSMYRLMFCVQYKILRIGEYTGQKHTQITRYLKCLKTHVKFQ